MEKNAGVEPLESRWQAKLSIHSEKVKRMPDLSLRQKLKDPTKTCWKGQAWTTLLKNSKNNMQTSLRLMYTSVRNETQTAGHQKSYKLR